MQILHSPQQAMIRVSALFAALLLFGSCASDGPGIAVESDRSSISISIFPRSVYVEYAAGFDFVFNERGQDRCGLMMKSVDTGRGLSLWFKSPVDSAGAFALCPGCRVHVLQDAGLSDSLSALRIATWSTTHVPLLLEAGGQSAWVASGYPGHLDGFDTSGVADLGGPAGIDKEALLACGADILTSYPFGNPMEGLTETTGVAVLPLEEYRESHPLARSEYVLLFGWLAGTAKEAESAFKEVKHRYLTLCEEARVLAINSGQRPRVFTGSEQAGLWHAPGGQTLAAQLIRDAGAVYMMDSITSAASERGNVQIDLERMLILAKGADFWGKVVYAPSGWSREAALSEVPWLDSDALGLFHCNTSTAQYFTRAVIEPHQMLADLLHIFHPDTVDRSCSYFQPTR